MKILHKFGGAINLAVSTCHHASKKKPRKQVMIYVE
jgi:hypothetical protein